jgi:GH25 family lysozyme M1 (1,4-beta-N-acetylmuramidase)
MIYPKVIDISLWNGTIDWAKLKVLGVGVIARIGQYNFEDTRFREHYANALKHGVPFGVYFFYQPNAAPQVQIDTFLKIYNSLSWKPKSIFLDVENIGYTEPDGTKVNIMPPSPEIHSVWLATWLLAVEKATGVTPGIYTRQNYWDAWVRRSGSRFLYNGTWYDLLNWNRFPLWIASWTNYSANIVMPKDWTTWVVWQYEGGTGRQDGVVGPCDLNSYNGTQDDMIKYFATPNGSVVGGTLIYNPLVAMASRGRVLTLTGEDKHVDLSVIAKDIDTLILRMGGSNQKDEYRTPFEDSAFSIRYNQAKTNDIPVIGRFDLDADYYLYRQRALPQVTDEPLKENKILKQIIDIWRKDPWTWETLRGDAGWKDLKAIMLGMTETQCWPNNEGTVNDTWQTATFENIFDKIITLQNTGVLPKIPVILYTGCWWLQMYQKDFAISIGNRISNLYLALGQWTLLNGQKTQLSNLAEVWKYLPAEDFKFSFVPDQFGNRILFHEFTQDRLYVPEITDNANATMSVTANLFNDTKKVMFDLLKFVPGTIVTPDPDPIPDPIPNPALEARVAQLELTVKKLEDFLKSSPVYK